MPILSAFLDESGDTGTQSDYYLLTLVFHEQGTDLRPSLSKLDEKFANLGFPEREGLHAGPLIRGEGVYNGMPLETRRKLFMSLFSFARTSGISYRTFIVKKREYPTRMQLKGRLGKELGSFLSEHLDYLNRFDTVITYYDNGQSMVTELLYSIFSAYLFNVEVRKASPGDYRLFQVADMFCTLELARAKLDDGRTLSKSEKIFFESSRYLKKTYLKSLDKLRFAN